MTEILSIRDRESLSTAVAKGAVVIGSGGIIAYPTDTVYGLGVDAGNEDSLRRLFELKGRSPEKAVSIMLADLGMLHASFPDLTALETALADEFLPGPLTLVVKTPSQVGVGGATVGVRVPDDEFCQLLVSEVGSPVTTTSANPSGMPPATSAGEVLGYFGGDLNLIVDGGNSKTASPSTVVDATGYEVRVLREGAIPAQRIIEAARRLAPKEFH